MSTIKTQSRRGFRIGKDGVTGALFIIASTGALVSEAAAEPRLPMKTGSYTAYSSTQSYNLDRTGSIGPVGTSGVFPRSARSSTLGNAEFPERDPIAQNLGGSAGGPLN